MTSCKCYREISLEVYGNDHDIIGNREIVRYLIKTEGLQDRR